MLPSLLWPFHCGLISHCSRQSVKMRRAPFCERKPIQSPLIVTLLSAPLARAYILNCLLDNSILLLSQAQGRDLEWGGRALFNLPLEVSLWPDCKEIQRTPINDVLERLPWRSALITWHRMWQWVYFIDRCHRSIHSAGWWWQIVYR